MTLIVTPCSPHLVIDAMLFEVEDLDVADVDVEAWVEVEEEGEEAGVLDPLHQEQELHQQQRVGRQEELLHQARLPEVECMMLGHDADLECGKMLITLKILSVCCLHLVDFVPADGRGGDLLLLGLLRVVEEVLPSVDIPAPVITLEIIELSSLQLH